MRPFHLLFIAAFLFSFLAGSEKSLAQEEDSIVIIDLDTIDKPKPYHDTVTYSKILFINYSPKLYFSDADHDLAKNGDLIEPEIRERIRYGLDFHICTQLDPKYTTKSLMRDTSQDSREDLRAVYEVMSYRYEYPTSGAPENPSENKVMQFFKKVKNKVSEVAGKNDEEQQEPLSEGQLTTEGTSSYSEDKYMNVKLPDKVVFTYLAEKYKNDLFLFASQSEIRTIYRTHADRWMGIFTREIWVHFSIYNKEGKQLYGDVAKIPFESNTNDVEEIIRGAFPKVGEYILNKVP